MKVAIMKPYFLPYIGYWQLMNKVDLWVVFDDIQFINKGWINRNRILHPDKRKEWNYITIPLKNRKQKDKICNTLIDNSRNWKLELIGKLDFYKNIAPYYKETVHILNECFNFKDLNLSNFVINSILQIKFVLDIKTKLIIQSKDLGRIHPVKHAGQWALEICKLVGAKEYINPIAGESIFKKEEFNDHGITLSFFEHNIFEYQQFDRDFVSGLSILDLFMFNNLPKIKSYL